MTVVPKKCCYMLQTVQTFVNYWYTKIHLPRLCNFVLAMFMSVSEYWFYPVYLIKGQSILSSPALVL